ncbi:2OG-Fe(II) oxygenase [Gammaproteobacteria bacterium]
MPSPCQSLIKILRTVRRPGEFYTTGSVDFFMPRIEVEGIGPLSLPLPAVQAEQLITLAEPAPYGRGEDTLVDTNVRRTWQVDAGRVRIEGRNWAQTLENIVARSAAGLGVDDPVVAEFYKLLVYDAGSFFVSHRDTEKSPGMFATLVIVLPSIYTGGELIVRHRDHEVRLDLYRSEPSEAAFAAFYADCVHEVLPITSGCRLTLIYNLVRKGKTQLLEPPRYDSQLKQATALLRRWVEERRDTIDKDHRENASADTIKNDLSEEDLEEDDNVIDEDRPAEKLIYILEHAYTPVELSFASLKGADAAVAPVLVEAARAANCELYLALATIAENGNAEHVYNSRSQSRWHHSYDEDDEENEENDAENFTVDEVIEREEQLSEWCHPDDSRLEIGALPFHESELCPTDAFQGSKPCELHFHEATGNEGASFERTYRRAALVLWPRERNLAVINQGGLRVTIPYLNALTTKWVATGKTQESIAWHRAHVLAGYMLRDWPRPPSYHSYWQSPTPSHAASMLDILVRLDDTASIDAFLSQISATGVYDGSENKEITRAIARLPPQRAAKLIERIIATNATHYLKACGNLLALCAAEDSSIDFQPAAAAFIASLPGDPARAPKTAWRQSSSPTVAPEVIADLLITLGRINVTVLANRTVEHLLAWPKTFSIDDVLIPVALRLMKTSVTRSLTATLRLRAIALDHLRRRIAEPLEPPRDWARANSLSCKCRHCVELARFLADPESRSWNFKAAESDRGHVQGVIQHHACDLNCTTERRGRPYTLQCVKNQASYERRVQQREKDITERNLLEGSNG